MNVEGSRSKAVVRQKRRRNPWPEKLPIHAANDPLVSLPDDHPAKVALISHARCKMNSVGREIPWPGRERDAVEQAWISKVTGKRETFSSLTYQFVSLTLILDGWLNHPPTITALEHRVLKEIPKAREMLGECRIAAESENNQRILELLPDAEIFFAAWEESVRARLLVDAIPFPVDMA